MKEPVIGKITFGIPPEPSPDPKDMVGIGDVVPQFAGLGFERVESIHGTSYKDTSTVILIPTRGTIHWKVVQAWQNLIPMMNQKRAIFFAAGHEVGQAYNTMIEGILSNPELNKWKYVLTLEDDNLPPPDALQRLIESIEGGKYDAVSGIYFTKGDFNMPMAYGNPDKYRVTGELDFVPRNIVQDLQQGTLIEVNGIAQGCSLYRMDLFKEMKGPWFVTVNDVIAEPTGEKGCFTQDLFFCNRARKLGKRFAVDCRVKVGHLDINTGIVY
jgi:hypothetical protein